MTTHVVTGELPLDFLEEYTYFGASVAAQGGLLVVGAWGDASFGQNSGAAYLFERDANGWALQAKLFASDAHAGARFGHSVAIDRGIVVVGSLYHASEGFRAGAAYAYERIGAQWVQTERLQPERLDANAYFGSSVAIHGDTIVVGASGPGARAAFLFERAGNDWPLAARIAPGTSSDGIRFGSSVSVHGELAIIGAWVSNVVDDDASILLESGSVYVVERRDGVWAISHELSPPDGEVVALFGYAVSTDGDMIVVGAPNARHGAWTFRRDGSDWQAAHVLGQVLEPDQLFGTSVAVRGGRVAVGAPGHNGHTGATYLFDQESAGSYSVTRLIPESTWSGVELGLSVALDAGEVFIGATGTTDAGIAVGNVYTLQ